MTTSAAKLVQLIASKLSNDGLKLCTAESCTGGLIAALLTDLPGSSNWFERGFVTYSNQAKTTMLSVLPDLIDRYGAVSEIVASAMLNGALQHSLADYAISVTGVAGPDGGSEAKPVGTVWIGVGSANHQIVRCYLFPGDRNSVRLKTAETALQTLIDMLSIDTTNAT